MYLYINVFILFPRLVSQYKFTNFELSHTFPFFSIFIVIKRIGFKNVILSHLPCKLSSCDCLPKQSSFSITRFFRSWKTAFQKWRLYTDNSSIIQYSFFLVYIKILFYHFIFLLIISDLLIVIIIFHKIKRKKKCLMSIK